MERFFETLSVNHPYIYSIFNQLKKEKVFDKNIPSSIPEAIDLLK